MLIDERTVALIADKYGAWIERLKRLYALGDKTVRAGHLIAWEGDLPQQLTWLLLARSTTALRSTLNLFCLGAETDAMSVFRTLAELQIDLEFIWTQDTAANTQRFVDFGTITARRKEELLLEIYGAQHADLDRQGRDSFERFKASSNGRVTDSYEQFCQRKAEQFAKAERKFANKEGKLPNQWARQDIRQRAKTIDPTERTYKMFYISGCEASHSGPATLFETRMSGPRDAIVPLNEMVLIFAASMYVVVLARSVHVLGLPQEPVVEAAREMNLHSVIETMPGLGTPPAEARKGKG